MMLLKIIRTVFIAVFIIFNSPLFAQTPAITQNGDEVVLYEDGTWEYANEEDAEENEISISSKAYTKKSDATFLLKSSYIDIGFYLNPKIWTFSKAESNTDAEYEIEHKEEDLYGIIITEKIEIPLENLRKIALANAKSVSPDIKITEEEYRMVNGLKVLYMRMSGTVEGMKISYLGYYYSYDGGTVQYLTYSSVALIDEHKEECENLLNGITEI